MGQVVPRQTRAERDEKIISLANEGKPPKEIALMLGISALNCAAILRRARRSGRSVPSFRSNGLRDDRSMGSGPTARVQVSMGAIDDLAGPARKRGVTPTVLAGRIIETVVENDLVNAVLDDGVR